MTELSAFNLLYTRISKSKSSNPVCRLTNLSRNELGKLRVKYLKQISFDIISESRFKLIGKYVCCTAMV